MSSYFSTESKGQRVAHFAQVTCFQNALRIRRFIYPNFFFARCLVEMFVFKLSIVSLGISMYQSAFSILEFGQNSIVVATVEKHKV